MKLRVFFRCRSDHGFLRKGTPTERNYFVGDFLRSKGFRTGKEPLRGWQKKVLSKQFLRYTLGLIFAKTILASLLLAEQNAMLLSEQSENFSIFVQFTVDIFLFWDKLIAHQCNSFNKVFRKRKVRKSAFPLSHNVV